MKRAELSFSSGARITVSVADSYFLRLRGLIGRDINEIGGLILKPCAQIHTFFMSYAIDVIYMDKENRILKIDENVPPKKVCGAVKLGRIVLELPAGTAKELKLNENDWVKTAKFVK